MVHFCTNNVTVQAFSFITDDQNRVILITAGGSPLSGYINASYIPVGDIVLYTFCIYKYYTNEVDNYIFPRQMALFLLLFQGYQRDNEFIASQGKCTIAMIY